MTQGFDISLNNVSKSFGNTDVLSDVSFAVRPGEIVALVGRSGTGKSTILRLMAGLDQPSTGQLAINGAGPVGIDSRVRYLFQEPRLLPWKRVLANVELGRTASSNRSATEMLERVGLGTRLRAWPEQLSGGERQRLALARALVGDPAVLLLDEPLSALDALTRLDMQALIEDLWREEGFTAVLVTHDVSEAVSLADRVLVVGAGEIVREFAVEIERPRTLSDDKQRYINDILAEILAQDSPLSVA